jgi:outer membrane protein assembly factor BamB
MHARFSLNTLLNFYLSLFSAIIFIAVCTPAARAQDTAGGSWLTFRGNPAHTGASSLEGPAGPSDSIQVKWRWQVNGSPAPISASPAVREDGTVIIGTEGGYVAAIRPNGGSSWIYKVEEPVKSSPSVDESGNVFAVTDDGYMYYLSANGELIWKSDFDTHTDSSPVISGGLAYLGTNNDELLTINLNPDMSNSGGSTKLPPWVVQQSSFLTAGRVHSSPAFSGNTVFFGGGEFVYALNPNADTTGGTLKWQFSINGDVNSSPAVFDGKVFVGADNGYLYAFSENIASSMNGSAFVFEQDPGLNWTVLASNTTNVALWQRKTGGKISSSPAVAAPASSATSVNMVYVGSDDGCLYAYDENGQYKWKFPTGAPISSSPAVDKNGDIYFGSENGSVYALFPGGALKWVYRTRGPVRSSPAIGPDKKLYIGSDDGYLYCIGESDEQNREPNFNIVDNASPDTIENSGNPTIVTAAVTSQSDDPNILSRIASVTLDLTPLLLIGLNPDTGEPEEISKVLMLDDGEGQDDFAGDGIFTFAFGITTDFDDPGIFFPENGIYTYLLLLSLAEFPVPAVGPVPLMVTVTDIYGHRVSKPFALNIAKKIEGSFIDLYEDQIINGLSNQTLDVSISITSGIVKSISIIPNTGTTGSIVQVVIFGQSTNFETDKTAVLICNNSDPPLVVASAPPGEPDVEVFDSTLLTAQLSIKDNIVNATGIWDVKVITDLGGCPEISTDLASFCSAQPGDIDSCEIVVANAAFTISSTPAQTAALQQTVSPDQEDFIIAAQEQCQLEFSMLNPAGAFAKDTPFAFSVSYPREFAVPLAANGTWTVNLYSGLSPNACLDEQTFKISARGSNYGLLTGQVTNAFTGERIDDVIIAAVIGDLSNIPNPLDLTKTSNSTRSSGGGFYMLPLAATRDKYTVFATKDGLIDIRNYVVIEDKQESTLNFSLKPTLSCPVTSLLKEGNLKNFYAVRDRILLNNPQGKRWVDLYYRHAPEVTDIILKHPDFRKKAAAFIMKAALESKKILKGEKVDRRMRIKLEELINSLTKVGSPELRNSLLSEKKAILDFVAKSD